MCSRYGAQDLLLLEAASALLALGRPFLMPPGVPNDRAEAMQAAFMNIFASVDFNVEFKKQQLDFNAPRTGAESRPYIERRYGLPNDVVIRLQRLAVQ